MNYEELTMVNNELKTVDIGKKKYVQVNDRVQGFRKLYPEGKILTIMVDYKPNEYCIFKCEVFSDDEMVLSTGYAQETIDKNKNINKTSMLENCETSAVGRALGFLGIGSKDAIASADEMKDAVIGDSLAADLVAELMEAGQSPDIVVKYNKVEDMSQLTFEQYNNVVKRYLKK